MHNSAYVIVLLCHIISFLILCHCLFATPTFSHNAEFTDAVLKNYHTKFSFVRKGRDNRGII